MEFFCIRPVTYSPTTLGSGVVVHTRGRWRKMKTFGSSVNNATQFPSLTRWKDIIIERPVELQIWGEHANSTCFQAVDGRSGQKTKTQPMPLHHWSPQAIVSVFRYQSVCPGGSLWQSEQSTSNKMCLPDFDVHQWKDANSAPWIWHWVPWEHPQVNNNTGWTNVQVQLFSQSTGRLFKMPLATQSADCSWCDCCWNRCLELWISITKWFPCGSSPWNNRCHLHLSEVWFLICTQRVSCFLVSWCRFDPEGAWWKHVHHFQGKHTSAGQAKAVA